MARRSAVGTKKSRPYDLLEKAKGAKIDFSATLDHGVGEQGSGLQRASWLQKNKEAFGAYNARVEKHGLFSDGQRQF